MTWALSAQNEEAPPTPDDPVAALQERFAALSEQLQQSPIQQGLYLESAESSRASRGDVYAVVDYSFATISDTFTNPDNWCDALLLHINVKHCRATTRDGEPLLSVAIGKKTDQSLKNAYRIAFTYQVTAAGPDYTQIILSARKGPLGTRNYNITLEFIALDAAQSFLHMRYAYAYGLIARLAMGFYFGGSGSSKVGFTVIAGDKGRPPHLVGGVRGALERNTMRYYLAMDATLGALAAPATERFEESMERWFVSTERYAQQLHEVDHDAYLAMKRREYLRQQQVPP